MVPVHKYIEPKINIFTKRPVNVNTLIRKAKFEAKKEKKKIFYSTTVAAAFLLLLTLIISY